MPIYEYEGKHYELPAGMSNEQAIAEIEAHLGKAPVAAKEEAPKEHSAALEAYGTFMRPLIKGLSAPVNLVADGLAATGNVAAMLAGSDMRFPLLSQLQDASLDAREYKGQKVYPRSDNPLVKAGQDAVEGTVGALATGPAMASREMVNTVPKMVATAAGSVAAPPVATAVAKATGYDALGQLAGMAAGAAVGGTAGKGAAAVSGERPAYLSLQELRDAASKAYQTVDNSGLTVKRSTANTMINDIQQELAKERFDPRLNPKVATTMEVINEIARQPLSLSKLDDLRKRAGDLLASQDANERRLGRVIINGIDEKVSNLTANDFYTGGNTAPDAALKALQEARTLTRNRARAEILDDAMTKAEVKAQMPNASEGELLRKAFNNIEADPKKFAQFNEQEQNVIKAINRGGPIDKGLSFLARFNPMRSQLTASFLGGGAAGGLASGNPRISAVAGGAAAIGYGADKLQGALRSRAAQDAVNQISNARFRAPSQGYSPQGLFGGGITAQDAVEMQRLFGQ